MAAYTNLLLIAALCGGTVYSLSCYTCTSQSSNSNCLTATNCSATATSCMTSVTTAGVGSLPYSITKSCSSACVATTVNVLAVSARVSCCSTDLCNISGASSIKSSYTATILGASLGVILVLLRSPSL